MEYGHNKKKSKVWIAEGAGGVGAVGGGGGRWNFKLDEDEIVQQKAVVVASW